MAIQCPWKCEPPNYIFLDRKPDKDDPPPKKTKTKQNKNNNEK